MDTAFLREFVELGRTLNFTETANKLYISRVTLSMHISMLEKQLGAPLFIRSTHNVYLTSIGKQFLISAQNILNSYDKAVLEIRRSLEASEGDLRIGFLDAAVRNILVSCVRQFKETSPAITLHLTPYELGELEKAVKDDEVDIALTVKFYNSTFGDEWCFKELYTDGLAAVVPITSKLADRASVKFSELLSEDLIFPKSSRYPVMAELIRKMAADAGYAGKPHAEYSHIDEASIFVQGASSCFIIPKHCDVFSYRNTKFIDLEDDEALIHVGALWKATNLNPAIPLFTKELMNFSKM